MNRSLPRPSAIFALLASTVALWPVVAAADGGCKTPFESGGCFVLTTLAIAFYSTPVAIAAAAVILVVGRRKARSAGVGFAALGSLPVVLVTGLAANTIVPNIETSPLLGVVVAAAAAYTTLVLRWLIQSAARA